ncbi:hypothetical protein RIF29_08456 [Crotalaria pallida]|uniref:Uncharacterized protein n=1 Tax=Crotalaria pallida TaxID=3830 RepID=A0AAN9FQU1_CROPI
MFRPLLSSVPSTTFYVGKGNSTNRSLVSRNSSDTTSSNASSSFVVDTEGSDHNHDDMASETDKILHPDINEEVFAFDKIDALNKDEEPVDILHSESKDTKIVFGPTKSEDSVHHGGIDTEANENSETSCYQGDIYETGSSENTAICSHCGCSYEASDQTEKNVGLCLECSRKTTMLRVIIPETTLAVSEDSSVDAEECQTSCTELIHDHSQNSPLPSSSVEEGAQMNHSGVDHKKPNNDFGDKKFYQCSSDPPNLNVNLMEGIGISALLKRSSSNKGPIIQGRSFTATTISYDDLSLARDSVNSTRSSTRHDSYSASSSVDFNSVRQSEFRVQRQFSGRKMDADCGYDLRNMPPSTGSSFSGTSNHSHYGLVLAARETSDNTERGFVEERIPKL